VRLRSLRFLWDHTLWTERRLRKLQTESKTECGMRVIEGNQEGLSRRWRHGTAQVNNKRLAFRPGLPGGIRLARPGQRWLTLDVLEVSRARERQAGGTESWAVGPQIRIVEVRTPTALIELAVTPEHRDWLLARLRG
jgi:hypothetical protein